MVGNICLFVLQGGGGVGIGRVVKELDRFSGLVFIYTHRVEIYMPPNGSSVTLSALRLDIKVITNYS